MEALPKDVLVTHIINRLPPKALLKLKSTCKRLNTLIEKTDIWIHVEKCLKLGNCVKCRKYVKIVDFQNIYLDAIDFMGHLRGLNMGAKCTQGCNIQWHERCIKVDQSYPGMICHMPNCPGYLYKGGLLHKGQYSYRGLYYSGE
jgi:hypothetical protein